MEDITLLEIIDYAKINEDNARQFYKNAAQHAKRDNIKGFLNSLVKEEEKHIEHLNELAKVVEAGGPIPKSNDIAKPLGYAEHLGSVKIDENSDYQEVLKFAIAREKEALDSYTRYTKLVDDPKAKELFSLLANEEGAHLRDLENKFDDFMKEIENW